MTRIKIYFSVRVVIPNDMQLVRLINRTIQHVVLQGPIFEAMLMDKESNNPMFQFLFDYTCPAHTYYRYVTKQKLKKSRYFHYKLLRWRLFSILNGESLTCWRTQKFRMYEGGPLWKPPILPFNQVCSLKIWAKLPRFEICGSVYKVQGEGTQI